MKWYEITILSLLQMSSIFLMWGKLNRKIGSDRKKSMYAVSVASILSTIFYIYEINTGFLINYVVQCIMVILLFKLPIKETIIELLIVIIAIAAIELGFASIWFWITGVKVVSFGNLLLIDLAVLAAGILINRFARLEKVHQYILKYKDHIMVTAVSTTAVILLLMYACRIYENFMWNHISHIIIIIVIWATLNMYFLFQSIQIRQQQRIIDVHEKYIPVLKGMVHEMRQKQHDFKNHLSVLYGIVQIGDDVQVKEKTKEYIDKLLYNIQPVDRLLNIDDQVLSAIIYSKKALARTKNVSFEIELKERVPEYPLEKYELVELLGNLLDNAIEAAESGGDDNPRVVLTLGVEEDSKIIKVWNTGKTIQQNHIDKVFQRGFSTKKGENRGYGLYNINRIVNCYDGTIELRSDNDYTAFEILFQ